MNPHHPHLPNFNSNPNSVESSNSTASVFLGGVRRSWMLDAPNNNLPSASYLSVSTPTPVPDYSATATVVVTAADAVTGRTRQQGMRESSALRALPVPSPSQENAASVVTGTAVPSQPNVQPPQTQQQFQRQFIVVSDRAGPPSMSPAATTATTNRAATQRSASHPVLNPIVVSSHPSGSSDNAIDRNGTSPSAAALPSPRTTELTLYSHQPPVWTAASASSPAGVGAVNRGSGDSSSAGLQLEIGGIPQQLQRRDSSSSHSHSPAISPTPPLPTVSPGEQMVHPPNASPHNPFYNPILNDAFYDHSLRILQDFKTQLRQKNRLGNIEHPRAELLTQACVDRDPLFLAIHQVYCLHSLAPQKFFLLPGYTKLQARGLDVVRRLLADNSRVSREFLRWSAQFPDPLVGSVQKPPCRQAVDQAGQCLAFLAERWPEYVQQVRSRGFPPLVSELVKTFGITSEALAYTIFLSACRTLSGSKSEQHLKTVWQLDLRLYHRRCTTPRPVSNEQIHEETQKVVQTYHSVSATADAQRPAPSPRLSHRPMPTGRERGPVPVMHPTTRPTNPGSPQIHNSEMSLPTPIQRGSSTSQGTITAPQSHSLPVPTAGSMLHPGALISQTIIPQMPSQIPYQPASSFTRMPTNASCPRSASIIVGSRRSSWTNGASSPQYLQPIHISDPMPSSTGALTQAVVPPSMVYPSQIAHPLSERNPSLVQAAASVQRHVAARPPQLERRNNEVMPSTQSANLGHQAQTPRSPFFRQMPHPHMAPRPPPTFLLPPPGSLPVNTALPQPLCDALHQAHLRDPHNSLLAMGPEGETEVELFQYFDSFAVPPTQLGRERCAFRWKFTLTQEILDQFPRARSRGPEQRSLRCYVSGNRVYRLRCIKIFPTTSEMAEAMWSVAESVWPSVLYVHVNGAELFVRRRVHNGKDLPLDITDHLQEGVNDISVHLIRSPAETNDMLYAMAIEVLEVSDLARTFALAQVLSVSECREQIRNRVSSSLPDDEVSVVSDHLSVNLVDPFTARIFDRPVRGRSCKHQDCFDHLTWIQTRASKSGKRNLKNDWKCPICARDARPQSLVIDSFLQEVRAELARTNQLEGARSILIKADGSWELRTEAAAQSSSERGAENTSERIPAKRKAATDNGDHSSIQRPKPERTVSVNESVSNAHPPEIIALD
ncbi:hypothetical protein BDV28DRAFT_137056 [Aspergillus coremiiformis]|uniref:SP-RING-type domain-containing protein n=1 Tax=Aspergillus coremiiformis TaxID=138285 RepID=A0A5N6Z1D5_9EURO|nr:hypothetical protein BDV28DRAFT_137056 [Aspergillus coremiiformis]